MIKISPSILSADFAHLADQVRQAEGAGADYIHVDVMDGHFVPNITLGPPVVASLRRFTRLPLDVHLMIEQPDAFIPAFAEAGADILTVHVEACRHLNRTIQLIKQQGVRAGVTFNPATPVSALQWVLADVDLVLLMTVNPGFGGQKFIPSMLGKIVELRAVLDEGQYHAELEVDGGVSPETAPAVVGCGARVLVAGSAIFGSPLGIGPAIAALRAAADGGTNAGNG